MTRTGGASTAALTRHLLDVGLITPSDVHRHGLRARDTGMSHAVAIVELGDGRGFVVKELRDPEERSQGTPEQERAVYGMAARHPELAGFVVGVPALGAGTPFLVLERRADVESGLSRAARTGWTDGQLAIRLGGAIGAWHELSASYRAELPDPRLPWVLRTFESDRPPFVRQVPAVAELLERLETGPLPQLLTETARLWRTDAAIHGDLRFDNCLVGAADQITFIDWEFGGQGDAAWDVAALGQEFVTSSPASDGPSLAPVLGGTVAWLVDAYLGARSGFRADADWVDRLRRFTGARLFKRALQLAAAAEPERPVDTEPERPVASEPEVPVAADTALGPGSAPIASPSEVARHRDRHVVLATALLSEPELLAANAGRWIR